MSRFTLGLLLVAVAQTAAAEDCATKAGAKKLLASVNAKAKVLNEEAEIYFDGPVAEYAAMMKQVPPDKAVLFQATKPSAEFIARMDDFDQRRTALMAGVPDDVGAQLMQFEDKGDVMQACPLARAIVPLLVVRNEALKYSAYERLNVLKKAFPELVVKQPARSKKK